MIACFVTDNIITDIIVIPDGDDPKNYGAELLPEGKVIGDTFDEIKTLPKRVSSIESEMGSEYNAVLSFSKTLVQTVSLTADQTIQVSALYPEWTLGSYKVGDIRLATYQGTRQPWKCRQEHDTTTYPDITPDGSAWRTFWIPFHGTTPETAQNWIAPSGAHDAYNAGDIVNYNVTLYQSTINGNVWSPDVYPAGWTVYEAATEPEEPEPEPEPKPDPDPEEPTTYPEWVQPTGSHDAYNTGDIVDYNGTLYRSLIDGNVWAPDAYPQGWEVYNG